MKTDAAIACLLVLCWKRAIASPTGRLDRCPVPATAAAALRSRFRRELPLLQPARAPGIREPISLRLVKGDDSFAEMPPERDSTQESIAILQNAGYRIVPPGD